MTAALYPSLVFIYPVTLYTVTPYCHTTLSHYTLSHYTVTLHCHTTLSHYTVTLHCHITLSHYTLSHYTMMLQSWTDERLKWEPHDYDNLMSISVLPEKLWMPDVQVFNSVGAASADTLHSPKVTDGTLYHTFGLVSRTPCELNLISFPFDVNTCFIQFGSWSEPNRRVRLSTGTL